MSTATATIVMVPFPHNECHVGYCASPLKMLQICLSPCAHDVHCDDGLFEKVYQ